LFEAQEHYATLAKDRFWPIAVSCMAQFMALLLYRQVRTCAGSQALTSPATQNFHTDVEKMITLS
jgi:hypothetical protein